MSAVLQHVRKYRPEWGVTYLAPEGQHQVARGLVAAHGADDDVRRAAPYDAEVQIRLYERWYGWGDRPNTRVAAALHECFSLPWDAECGRYHCEVTAPALAAASLWLHGQPPKLRRDRRPERRDLGRPYVAVHYQGDSARDQKDLSHQQADDICLAVAGLGCRPLVLDWRDRCPLTLRRMVTPQEWGRDAEMVCAVVRHCAAFVGVDSGPAKCASATDVPSLVVWTGHHPAQFHDPALNTTHLVPEVLRTAVFGGATDAEAWFAAHYQVRYYRGDPVVEVEKWLEEVLQ